MAEDFNKEKLPKGPIAWMAQNSVAANLLMIIFIVGGLLVASQVKQEVFPEFTSDIVTIAVPYPGASPEEVEQGIILSIEDKVRGLEGVKRVTSTAAENAGSVVVELLESSNEYKVLQDVKNEVDRITSFPEDAERPIVSLAEIRREVISLLIYGEQSLGDLRDLAERVRDDLISRPGVTLVELGLAPIPEISIEVPLANLRSYGLTLEEIANKIRNTALELPAGEIKTSGGQILLRTQERREYAQEFLNIPVASNPDGSLVLLKSIANLKDSFEDKDEEAFFEGLPGIEVQVFRVGNETPQDISDAVYKYIDEIKLEVPDSVNFKILRDSSVTYKDRLNLLIKNAGIGLLLVSLLLGLFLEVRLAFWVMLGIPISILGSFLIFPAMDASINMISLFAFIVSLGIVVDDAVVAGENIFDEKEAGREPLAAAVFGARAIAMPIVFAVLTNIVAFMPLFMVPGVSGKFFRQIPAVVVCVFAISLIESLYILPAHLAHKPKKNKFIDKLNQPGKWFSVKLKSFVDNKYAPAIKKIVKFRYATIAASIGMLIIALGALAGGHIRFTFMPIIDADNITVQAELPFGIPMEESRKLRLELIKASERALKKAGGSNNISKGIYSQIGRGMLGDGPVGGSANISGSHIVVARVTLVPSDQRTITGTEFARIWRKEIGSLPGVESLVFKSDTGASEGAAIDFNLSHRSREITETAAEELAEILAGYAGAIDIDDGVQSGKPQYSFKITPEAESLGITVGSLARQLRSAFYGAEALRQQRGRNEIKVMLRLPKDERQTLETLDQFIIRTPDGGELALSEAAKVVEGKSYTKILRRNGTRVISVTADVDDTITNANQIISSIVKEDLPKLIKKYPGLSYSFGGEKEAQTDTLNALKLGFILSMILIYALLAIPFRSYLQPIIVMLSIPFGTIGAIAGHSIVSMIPGQPEYTISIISMFGIIALAGVVVNDSLVLIVKANEFRAEGKKAEEAVSLAGIRRFRPILLTSLTTFFGLSPMIFESSQQARFLIPMAISLGFGIIFATFITLAIVPCVYIMLEDIQMLWQKLTKRENLDTQIQDQ